MTMSRKELLGNLRSALFCVLAQFHFAYFTTCGHREIFDEDNMVRNLETREVTVAMRDYVFRIHLRAEDELHICDANLR